jgi:hypothetical protein
MCALRETFAWEQCTQHVFRSLLLHEIKRTAMAYLTRFCKSVIDIKQQHRVLDRALVERRVNRSGGSHLDVCARSRLENESGSQLYKQNLLYLRD